MLAGQGVSSKYMFNGLSRNIEIQKVLIEDSPNKIKFLRRRIKKMGILKVVGQVLFIYYSKILYRFSKKKILKLEKSYNLDHSDMDKSKIIRVKSVNSKKVKSLIKSLKPDIIIVNGTRIISKNILNSTNALFLNTHMGITPKYRGVHGGYWALVNNDIENFGTTVHIVDPGIDTGDIVYQNTTSISKKDNFSTYPVHQIYIGIKMMTQAVLDYKSGKLKTIIVNHKSRLWSHPDIFTYLKNRIFNGVK